MTVRRRMLAAPAAGLVALLLAACSPAPGAGRAAEGRPSSVTTVACPPGSPPTRQDGQLTWAAPDPGRAPWVIGDPQQGRGYEAAVAAAVSRRLGFRPSRTRWVPGAWESIAAPGEKAFDVGFDRVDVTAQRGAATDLSAPYYDVRQAVVALASSPRTAQAHDLSDLARLRLGARAGSDALQAVDASIRPATPARTFPAGGDADVQALQRGDVDALVVDVPRAFLLRDTSPAGSIRIVGTLPQTSDDPVRYGFVLPKGSRLTACVSAAVESLRADGTLARLERQWLTGDEAPELS